MCGLKIESLAVPVIKNSMKTVIVVQPLENQQPANFLDLKPFGRSFNKLCVVQVEPTDLRVWVV